MPKKLTKCCRSCGQPYRLQEYRQKLIFCQSCCKALCVKCAMNGLCFDCHLSISKAQLEAEYFADKYAGGGAP